MNAGIRSTLRFLATEARDNSKRRASSASGIVPNFDSSSGVQRWRGGLKTAILRFVRLDLTVSNGTPIRTASSPSGLVPNSRSSAFVQVWRFIHDAAIFDCWRLPVPTTANPNTPDVVLRKFGNAGGDPVTGHESTGLRVESWT